MAIKFDGDDITFTSGRSISCNRGIVGIVINPESDDFELSGGYDNSIDVVDDYEDGPSIWHLVAADAAELADAMIARWQAFKDAYGKGTAK